MKIENLKLKIPGILAFFVFLISFGVYIFTLNPTLSAADSTEIVTTSLVLGIPHQPSYPVSTIIGHLFAKIPYGTLPWRVNLMSAFFQAVTATLVYFVILKLYGIAKNREAGIKNPTSVEATTGRQGEENSDSHNSLFLIHDSYYLLAAASALFLAFSLEFWQFATRAEVFPLNNFFGAALTLILVSWWGKIQALGTRQQELGSEKENSNAYTLVPKPSASPSRKILQKYSFIASHLPQEALKRWSAYQPPLRKAPKQGPSLSLRLLYLLFFVGGLAFTHHQTIVLLGPALLFLLLSRGVSLWWKKGVLVKLILCFLLGVLPYFSLIPMARANPPVRWGDPTNLKGVFKALTRSDYGTFSPYAQNPAEIEGQRQKETPVTQQTFYLKSLNQDFTFLGLTLAFLGAFYLVRRSRRIFLFIFLGFFFAGPFFLGFANYTLDSGFHQAVAKRFQMLPDVFFILFLAFGFFFLWEKFQDLKLDFRERKNLLVGSVIMVILSFSFLYPLIHNFKDADNRHNLLTINYARDSVFPTPQNAIILISGDVTTFAFEYWRTIVEKDDRRVVFSPGLLYLDWYVKRLKKEHPEIVIPPAKPGRLQASTTEIVDANWGKRPIYISPELSRYDPGVEEKYVLWPKHLLFLVKQKGEDLRLEPYREENEALWRTYDLELFERVRKNNPLLEYAMVPEYARHHFNTGAVFESVHLYDDAIREYERALKIHPAFPDPYKNLGRIYGFKLKNRDFQKAWDNFQMFLATALPSQQEDVEAVWGAMGALQEEAIREATMGGQLKEATPGGETATSSAEASPSGKSLESTQDQSFEFTKGEDR